MTARSSRAILTGMRTALLAVVLALAVGCGAGTPAVTADGAGGGECPERVYAYGALSRDSEVLDGVCGANAGLTADEWMFSYPGPVLPTCLTTCTTTDVNKSPVGTESGCEALAIDDAWADDGRFQFSGGPVLCFPPDGGNCASVCHDIPPSCPAEVKIGSFNECPSGYETDDRIICVGPCYGPQREAVLPGCKAVISLDSPESGGLPVVCFQTREECLAACHLPD